MKILEASKKDLKEIALIFKEEFSREPYNEKWTEKSALKKVKSYFLYSKIHIAKDSGGIIGFVISSTIPWDNYKKAFINEILVRKSRQNNGVGSALLEFMESYYKRDGAKLIELASLEESDAYQFYIKRGYLENKMVIMEKKL